MEMTMEGHIKQWMARATPEQVDGMFWYQIAHEKMVELANRHTRRLDTVCAITAILSPTIRWEKNVESTDIVLSTGQLVGVPGYNNNRYKALAVYHTDDVSLVSGPKVSVFYRTLLNPEHREVTVDRWAGRAAGHYVSNEKAIGKKLLKEIAGAYENVADDIGISPSEVQAWTWSVIRQTNDWESVMNQMGALS